MTVYFKDLPSTNPAPLAAIEVESLVASGRRLRAEVARLPASERAVQLEIIPVGSEPGDPGNQGITVSVDDLWELLDNADRLRPAPRPARTE